MFGTPRNVHHRYPQGMEALLRFEGVMGFGAGDAEEAAHFFEHTLGLELAGEEGGLRLYELSPDLTLAVDASGAYAGQPPYLLFSADDLAAASEHFLARGCEVREMDWGDPGLGFLARAPEGHTVCVVSRRALMDEARTSGARQARVRRRRRRR